VKNTSRAFHLLLQIICDISSADKRNAHSTLIGKPEGKRPFGRSWRTWEGNIRMDRREIEQGVTDWIHLAQDRDQWPAHVNTVMNLRVP
jgi:hypothetical protein